MSPENVVAKTNKKHHLQGVNLQVTLPYPELALMNLKPLMRTPLVDPISAQFMRVTTSTELYGN